LPNIYRAEKRLNERKKFNRFVPFVTIKGDLDRVRYIKGDGFSLDISEGGLGFKADRSFRIGDILKISLPMPRINISIPVFAEVMWVKPKEDHFRAWLRFLQ